MNICLLIRWIEEGLWYLGKRNLCSSIFGMTPRFGALTPMHPTLAQAFPPRAMPHSKSWMGKGTAFILSSGRWAGS